MNDQYRNTSVIHTLREHWPLGQPFSAREATAANLDPVLSLETPRDPDDWPDVHPRPVPAFDTAVYPPELPLRGLAKALFFALLALGKELGQTVSDVSPDAQVKGAEGLAIMREMFAHMFPNLNIET